MPKAWANSPVPFQHLVGTPRAERVHLAPSSCYQVMWSMCGRGLIERVGNGRYLLTTAGSAVLATLPPETKAPVDPPTAPAVTPTRPPERPIVRDVRPKRLSMPFSEEDIKTARSRLARYQRDLHRASTGVVLMRRVLELAGVSDIESTQPAPAGNGATNHTGEVE